MSWVETLRTGLAGIRSHRLRSMLTMLGILIGIAAVMLTVGLGEGAQQQVSSEISSLGSNLLIVTPGSTTSNSGVRGGFGSATTLTEQDAAALENKTAVPDIAHVAATSSTTEELAAGSSNWTTSVIGTTPSWLTVRDRTMAAGRFLTSYDESSAASVVVLGSETASELFGAEDPIGQTVTIGSTPFTVVGELAAAGSSSSTDEDDEAIIPMSTAAIQVTGGTSRNSLSDIYLEATGQNTISAAYQEADAELLNLHDITNPSDADFTISSQQSILKAATSVDSTLTVLLGGIAAISLLVGGIGVMNIMLVSVTERIREIGLRKALGATPAVIRRQFLVEASMLGLVGGTLGVVVGLVGAFLLPHFISDPIAISPVAAAGAIVVSILIGIGFGVYPATRAARLAPIDALRSE